MTQTEPMRAFLARVSKGQLLAALEAHAAADRIIQGHYWLRGRGCAVGCTLHDFATGEESRHDLYPELFGIPEVLAYLEDGIFEALPRADARAWPLRFVRAIPEGADLTLVWPRFAVWLLADAEEGLARHARTGRQRSAIEAVAALYARIIAGEQPSNDEWTAARSAARSVASTPAAAAAGPAWIAFDAPAAAAAAAGGTAATAVLVAPVLAQRLADKLIEILETAA